MALHQDFIKSAVKKAVKDCASGELPENFEKILTAAIYNVLNDHDFEQMIKEIVRS